MTGKWLAILNPAAGGGKCGRQAEAAVQRLQAAGLDVETQETMAAGDGTTIARAAYERGVRQFIAVGGDGTGYEVVNGLFPNASDDGEKVSLGFMPLGTGNSFLRDFTDDGAEYAIQSLLDGKSRSCDVIRLTHRDGVLHYINILSMGFTAEVGALTNNRFKAFGQGGYIMGVVTSVARLNHFNFPMVIDGEAVADEPCTFISINNSRYTGGKMLMAPQADIGDGKADLITVGQLSRVGLLRTFPKIFKGEHVNHPSVNQRQVKKIDFDLDHEVDV
ncbi:MAG TPA: YegS/Rv2252/BmrU family lipid kinase, partial [Myxococcales bacterium]|nr:YegS/Rv2252/BmrU family lipid kinase [Myxococcales bacterium]